MAHKKSFEISSHIVRQLGEQLITDGLSALLELAKNSYDANASYVKITIDSNHTLPDVYRSRVGKVVLKEGYILIEDDGSGMSEVEVLERWMTISYSNKRKIKEGAANQTSRYPLGDKGVGRLSTQKLGEILVLVTTKDEVETSLFVDWRDFVAEKKLSEIQFDIQSKPVPGAKKGTKIAIADLISTSEWENKSELEARLIQLVSPYSGAAFRAYVYLNNEKLELAEKANKIRDLAISSFDFSCSEERDHFNLSIKGKFRISGLVSTTGKSQNRQDFVEYILADQGQGFLAFLTDKTRNRGNFLEGITAHDGKPWLLSFETKRRVEFRNTQAPTLLDDWTLGGFEGVIDSYSLQNVDELAGLPSVFGKLDEYKAYIESQAGIRLYRDGFGIRPFGFEGNDWLGLGDETTSGGSFYSLRPKNTLGAIFLKGGVNKNLIETTSREGLVNNSAYKEFLRILKDTLLSQINKGFIEKIRRSYNDFIKEKKENSQAFDEIRSNPRRWEDVKNVVADQNDKVNKLASLTKHNESEVKRLESRGELFLSPEDKAILEVRKESLSALSVIKDSFEKGLSKLQSIPLEKEIMDLKITSLEEEIESLWELAALGMATELLSHEISHIVSDLYRRSKLVDDFTKANPSLRRLEIVSFIEHVRGSASGLRKQVSHIAPSMRYVREERREILVEPFLKDLQSYHQERLNDSKIKLIYTSKGPSSPINANRGRLIQVIDNLILNAEYWLKVKVKNNANWDPIIEIESEGSKIRIWDNGDGVDPEIESRIFQPFITTKPKGEGRGLGLYVCERFLESIDGTIQLLPNRNPQGRRYIFEISF